MRPIRTHGDVQRGAMTLAQRDPLLAEVIEQTGLPPLRRFPGGVPGLVRLVVYQSVSTRSAAAVAARLVEETDLEPTALVRIGVERLREIGLTRAKAGAVVGIASAALDGCLDFRRLRRRPDEEVREVLLGLKGVGPWTADLYLLSCLGRPDVWPSGDLAIRAAAGRLHGLASRPSIEHTDRLAETWKPLRSVAARILWHYYAHLQDRPEREKE